MTRKQSRYPAENSGKTIPKKRLFLFKVISILVPFVVLILLEILLRVFHYGYDPGLFIEYPADKNYLVMNPEASKIYFAQQALATTGNAEYFRKEKGSNTFRIFVLGESTTIGYPYFHNGSFHRWLQYRLAREFPGKNFEIINVSLTAVNSYTVLGFAQQIVHYEPDAVMIYTGHNEYYGALGVASTDKISGNQFWVKAIIGLRKFRFVQWLSNAYYKVSGLFSSKKSTGGKTRMEIMVGNQDIAYQSELYKRGVAQFRSNLNATLELLNRNNIPVLISNLVSNEKDLKPFIDLAPDSIRYPTFQQYYQAGIQSLQAGDSTTALHSFTQANRVYAEYASCNYYLGRLALGKADYKKATMFFRKALDLDALRFRAPTAMNEVITELSTQYPNTHLVDAKMLFESHSFGNIVGDELILEHVHPNLLGYALLSDGFYTVLKKEVLTESAQNQMSFTELLKRMPVTALDSITGAYRIEHLKSGWPFQKAVAVFPDSSSLNTEEKKVAYAIAFQRLNWSDAQSGLYKYYIDRHDLANAKTLAETLVLEYPEEETYYNNAANICGELKDYDNAVYYFRKTFDFSPSVEKARFIFPLYLLQDKPAEALPFLDYAINNGPASLKTVKALVQQIIDLKSTLRTDTNNLAVLNQVAGKYMEMGNREVAAKYLEKILMLDAHNKNALSLQAQFKNR